MSAADEYMITGLVAKCEALLIEALSISNVCDFFYLAFLHLRSKLRSASVDFMVLHAEEIAESSGWKRLREKFETEEAFVEAIDES